MNILKRGKFEPKKIILPILIFLSLYLYSGVFNNAHAYLLNAIDELGQIDTNSNPVWTNGGLNNSSTTISGSGFSFSGFFNGIAIDSAGHRLFAADESNSRVLVFNLDSDNNIISRQASYVIGQPDFNSNTATTTQNSVGNPRGIAYDSIHKRLFVSDSYGLRVMVFDLSNGITNGMNASYVLGQPDFVTAVSSEAAQNDFNRGGCDVRGVDYDASLQRLFVSDCGGSRVMVFDLSNGITNGMNASYVLGQPDFVTLLSGVVSQNTFASPEDIIYDSTHKRLFVGDGDNNRILIFDLSNGITNGMNASYVLGQPDFTSIVHSHTQNTFNTLPTFAYDVDEQVLFVNDQYGNRILAFDVSNLSNDINAFNVLGQVNFTDVGSTTTQSGLNQTSGARFDAISHTLWAVDAHNNRIVVFKLPFITTTSLLAATVSSNYSENITVIGGQAPYVCNTSDPLPSGMALSLGCSLSGIPTTAGTYNFTIMALDSAVTSPSDSGFYYNKIFNLTINAAPVCSIPSVSNGSVSAYPACTITCNSGYDLSGNSCVMSGGGGLPPEAYMSPRLPDSGQFLLLINNGDKITDSQTVNLALDGGPDARMMIISEDPDFKITGQQSYAASSSFQLSSGNGEKTIYAKFYTRWGRTSPVISSKIILAEGAAVMNQDNYNLQTKIDSLKNILAELVLRAKQLGITLPAGINQLIDSFNFVQFTQNLVFGSRGEDVGNLQKKLQSLGFFPLNREITSYFGNITLQALKDFQKNHNISPIGILGPQTRAILNAL